MNSSFYQINVWTKDLLLILLGHQKSCQIVKDCVNLYLDASIQARIAQLVAYRLGTGEVPGSNPGKGENFSVKIGNCII